MYNPNKYNENTISAYLSGLPKLCCIYCQGEHFPTKFDKVTNANAFKGILKNSFCCCLCLKTGNVSNKMYKHSICQICRKKHQIKTCEGKNKQSPNQSPNAGVSLDHK